MALDPHLPNAVHSASGPDDAWSTTNTRENFAGVMSPLGATLWLPLSEIAVNSAFYDLGVVAADEVRVAERPCDKSASVFYGRYTAGVSYFRQIADRIPGTSGDAFEEQMFGSTRQGASVSTKRRYPHVAVRAPRAIALSPRRMRELSTEVDEWWRQATSPAALARPALPQLELAMRKLGDVMRTHVLVTFVAQGVFDGLGKLCEQAGRPGLHLELSTGYGEMVETVLVARLQAVAAGRLSLEAFPSEYGYRCAGEIEVSNPSWRERPEIIERLVEKYRSTPGRVASHEDRARTRVAAERLLLGSLPRVKRPLGRVLLRLAHTFIPLREAGKSVLARTFDGARAACGTRGHDLFELGVIDDPRDVFFLTLEEIRRVTPPADARELISARKELHAYYETVDVADHWIGPPVPHSAVTAGPGRVAKVTGVAVSPGVVEGRVRVMANPDDADELEEGEILVCRTTDPSWASVFFLVAAVVIDIGSTSSHGAIVAREMGIPCVIGTSEGTTLLRSGDLVRIDGSAGTVIVLEPAGAPA